MSICQRGVDSTVGHGLQLFLLECGLLTPLRLICLAGLPALLGATAKLLTPRRQRCFPLGRLIRHLLPLQIFLAGSFLLLGDDLLRLPTATLLSLGFVPDLLEELAQTFSRCGFRSIGLGGPPTGGLAERLEDCT